MTDVTAARVSVCTDTQPTRPPYPLPTHTIPGTDREEVRGLDGEFSHQVFYIWIGTIQSQVSNDRTPFPGRSICTGLDSY